MLYDLSVTEDKSKFNDKISLYLEMGYKVDLKIVKQKRTIQQNAFLHVLITLFGIEFGYTIEEAKTHLKRSCPFMRYQKNDEWFLKRTSEMNVDEISEFMEWIYNHSAQNGLILPTSESYNNNYAYFNNLMESHKEFS